MLDQISSFVREYFFQLTTGLSLLALAWFRKTVWRLVSGWWKAINHIRSAKAAIESDRPWLVQAPRPAPVLPESSIPIITIANLKGGVGKTTVAANLAAYFSLETKNSRTPPTQKKVLAIDLDFQGSLSSILLTREERIPEPGAFSDASRLIMGAMSHDLIVRSHRSASCPNIRVIPAYYDVARAESRLQMKWLIGEEKRDVRYFLKDVLRSEEIQKEFDLIIIDAPPRLTTATIQALCASTHLLIPTILDRMSGEAVGSFVDQIEELRTLWPKLKYVGIVGTMLARNPALANALLSSEQSGITAIEGALQQVCKARNLGQISDAILPRATFVADSELIRKHAAEDAAFAALNNSEREREVKNMFRALGAEVERRLQ